MKKNQKGFGIVELLLILLVAGLVVGAGWYMWGRKNKEANSSTAQSTKNTDKTTQQPKFLAELAKTQDQKDIAASILDYCISLKWDGVDSKNGRVIGRFDDPDDPDTYKATNTNASIAAACYSVVLSEENQPTGRRYLLHKDVSSSKKWIVDSAEQDAPACEKLDGHGYTSDISWECYDNSTDTSRAPKP